MNLPELLAPLNNWKSITPTSKVLENADAVYFGLQSNFSMRARAENFSFTDMPELMKKVHNHGKKGYLATNIIIYNQDLVDLYQTIEQAKKCEVDAIICHDLSAVMIAKQIGIPFHISTQANVSNNIAAKFYETLGANRIILARELDLKQIIAIINSVNIPIECFVHGAMCTAISGRCYFSGEIMGYNQEYSANRGRCLQPCRRSWTITGELGEIFEYDSTTGYFFNVKDLCMIGHLPQLIDAHIGSFKIEGRMRDPLYIEETVACYREALDAIKNRVYSQALVEVWMSRLNKIFNRGYHTGFYFQTPQPEDIEVSIRGNISKWKKIRIGKVINYDNQIGEAQIELTEGKIGIGTEIVFENLTNFYYHRTVDSIRMENQLISESPKGTADNHIIIGIKTEIPIPIDTNVFIFASEYLSKERE